MRILWIVVPGLIVGFLVLDSVRRIFSEDDRLLWKLFQDQPVTMAAVVITIGSVIVWAVLEAIVW